jgi:hypothetical protein
MIVFLFEAMTRVALATAHSSLAEVFTGLFVIVCLREG